MFLKQAKSALSDHHRAERTMEIADVLQNTKHFQISIRVLSGNGSKWRNLPQKHIYCLWDCFECLYPFILFISLFFGGIAHVNCVTDIAHVNHAAIDYKSQWLTWLNVNGWWVCLERNLPYIFSWTCFVFCNKAWVLSGPICCRHTHIQIHCNILYII